jgi:hypothetical protein
MAPLTLSFLLKSERIIALSLSPLPPPGQTLLPGILFLITGSSSSSSLAVLTEHLSGAGSGIQNMHGYHILF